MSFNLFPIRKNKLLFHKNVYFYWFFYVNKSDARDYCQFSMIIGKLVAKFAKKKLLLKSIFC